MKMEILLQDAMKKAVDENLTAGVSLLLEKDGKELCFLAEGMADIENQKPIQRDTIFRLYSQTKPVTATAAMILVERGLLDLGQPVSDFLPAFKHQYVWKNNTRQAPSREILVHDLLNMTSGLVYPDESCESGKQTAEVFKEIEHRLYGEHPMTTIEVADMLGACVLDFDPGSSMRYGTSADILGAVIEIVSGIPFSEFIRREITGPLEMKDTAFWVPIEKQNRLSQTYKSVEGQNKNTLKRYDQDHLGIQNRMKKRPAFESGGAGLASTLDDYMRFARMLLSEGRADGIRILKKETVKYMVSAELTEEQQKNFEKSFLLGGHSYANLMRICKNPSRSPYLARKGEYGWDGWLGPYFANFPKENITLLMGMQKTDAGTWALTRKLRNIILSSI